MVCKFKVCVTACSVHISYMHTTNKGSASALMVAARLALREDIVLTPTTDNLRYDLVIDQNGKFSRIQAKTGWLRKGIIMFNTVSSSPFTNNGKPMHYKGQIEYFGVYCPDNDKCYLVPIEEAPSRLCILRIEPPRNNQKRKIRLAADFEI